MDKVKCSICGKEVGGMMAHKLKDGYACGTCFDEAVGKKIGFDSINSEEFSVEIVREGLANNKMVYEQEESFCEEKASEKNNIVDEENSEENESNEKNRENTNQNAFTEEKEENPTTNTGEFKLKYIYYALFIIGIILVIKYFTSGDEYIDAVKRWRPFENGPTVEFAFFKACTSAEWDYLKQDGVKLVQFEGKERGTGNDVLIQFKIEKVNKERFEWRLYRVHINDMPIDIDTFFWHYASWFTT